MTRPHSEGDGHAEKLPRPEYPRPQLRRDGWTNLNGRWRFVFDDADVGRAARWQDVSAATLDKGDGPLTETIVVPFCVQSPLSGIGDPTFHDIVWYARTFESPRDHPASGQSSTSVPSITAPRLGSTVGSSRATRAATPRSAPT